MLIDKLIWLITENAKKEKEDFNTLIKDASIMLLENSLIDLVKMEQHLFLKSGTFLIGRKLCIGCQEAKAEIKGKVVYLDVDMVIEVIAERTEEEISLPILVENGKVVYTGTETLEMIEYIKRVENNNLKEQNNE